MAKSIIPPFENIEPSAVLVMGFPERRFYSSFENNDAADQFRKSLHLEQLMLTGEDDRFLSGQLSFDISCDEKVIEGKEGLIVLSNGGVISVCFDEVKVRGQKLGQIYFYEGKEKALDIFKSGEVKIYLEWGE